MLPCILWSILRTNLCAYVSKKVFNYTVDRSHSSNHMIPCGLIRVFFASLASLKVITLLAPGILCTFFNPFVSSINDNFTNFTNFNDNYRDQTEVSSV